MQIYCKIIQDFLRDKGTDSVKIILKNSRIIFFHSGEEKWIFMHVLNKVEVKSFSRRIFLVGRSNIYRRPFELF